MPKRSSEALLEFLRSGDDDYGAPTFRADALRPTDTSRQWHSPEKRLQSVVTWRRRARAARRPA